MVNRPEGGPGDLPPASAALVSPAPSGQRALPRSAWVQVDLGAIVWNTRLLRRIAGPRAAVAAVVKADGYGHGIELAARAAIAGGATFISVATADEALALRGDGSGGRILVNYPVPPEVMPELAACQVEVAVGSEHDVRAISALGRLAPAAHLEVDTGMCRGGVRPSQAGQAARQMTLAGVRVVGVWSHLAEPECAARTADQVRQYEEALVLVGQAGVSAPLRHLCATGGLLAGAPVYDLVRPGLALYGLRPLGIAAEHPDARRLRPALSVRARAVRLEDVTAGSRVGYGGSWVAPRPSRIATIPLGYADGWSRGAAPATRVLVRGVEVPVVGRISSDSMTLDVTAVCDVGWHDEYVLLGEQDGAAITADDVAAARNSISWEVLQTLARRLPRVYRIEGESVAIRTVDRARVSTVEDLDHRMERLASPLLQD